jgi:cyclic pyranopterin phosphate synthase
MSEQPLTHLNERGEARMVDVAGKDVTVRSATARCRVTVSSEVADLLRSGDMPKGDALAVARIAAIQATKRTPDLIPLCHPISVHGVDVDVTLEDGTREGGVTGPFIEIRATVRTADRTGVEMEALTAAAVGGLTVIDMVKGKDRTAAIADVVLLEKLGGRSGHWVREA